MLSTLPIPTTTEPSPVVPSYKRALAKAIAALINQVYTQKLDRIISIMVADDGVVEGVFQDEDRLFDFYYFLEERRLEYKLSERSRSDSYMSEFLSHLDAKPKMGGRQKQCTVGINCGGTCIQASDVCRINNVLKVAAPKTLDLIDELAKKTKEVQKAPPGEDDLSSKTIRQLRDIAKKEGVSRYSRMTTQELRGAIRTAKSNPEQQERIRKTIEKSRSRRKEIENLAPKGLVDTWNRVKRISKVANTSPDIAAIMAASLVAGASVATMNRLRDRYKSGLEESANMAMQRAQGVKTVKTGKENLMFTVGGFASDDSRGQRMKDILEGDGDGTNGDRWFKQANEIIPFNHPEFDIDQFNGSKRNADGSYNPAYLGHLSQKGFGKFLQNFGRGRNEAAVDLAAQLYANGATNPKAKINILGHRAGGNVTREAVEILNRMRPPDGRGLSGPDIVKRLNIVNMGTPYFGFTNDKQWNSINHRTITTPNDPLSILPKQAAQWISSVRGGEVDDYLGKGEVRERLREAFGYYSNSLTGQRMRMEKQKQTRGAIGEALDLVGFGQASRLYKAFNRVNDMAKENPAAATILGAGIAASMSGSAYAIQRNRYRKNTVEAAKEAYKQAQDIENSVPNVRQKSATFVVGGSGAPAQDMVDTLNASAAGGNKDAQFVTGSHIVTVDPTGLPQQEKGALNGGGPIGFARTIQNAYGAALKRTLGAGKNSDAIALAAQLHAYGSKTMKSGKVERNLRLNVLAGSNGGNVSREALDILSKMPGGAEIAKRVQLVTLGSPHMGLASDEMKEQQLIGDGDPASNFPFFHRGGGKSEKATDVDSHDPNSYLTSGDALGKIAETFRSNIPKRAKSGNPPAKSKATPPPLDEWKQKARENTSDPNNPRNRPDWDKMPLDKQDRLMDRYFKAIQTMYGMSPNPTPKPPAPAPSSTTKAAGWEQKAKDNTSDPSNPRNRPGWDNLPPGEQDRLMNDYVEAIRVLHEIDPNPITQPSTTGETKRNPVSTRRKRKKKTPPPTP